MSTPAKHTPRGLTDIELKAQGTRCGCRGADDYCVCQNVPDAITIKEWGLTPRGPIPSVYFNIIDLLQKIARPDLDPSMDIADGVTLMDYWRRDAARLLPSIIAGHLPLDEELGKLLHDASWKAQSLRDLRTEVRGPSANFPSSVPVQWAQDAAKAIDQLVGAVQARAVTANVRAAPSILAALIEAEAFIARTSGGGETDFRAKLNDAIRLATPVLEREG